MGTLRTCLPAPRRGITSKPHPLIMTTSRSIVVGTLVGGAVGDAMGAPFEGLWSDDVPNSGSLVSSFHECHGYPAGQYTDDTQLTIATIQSVDQPF
jgi:ADP-ribosylglycohydrolase